MLVIISDLHLTDGTSGETISDSAFRLFKNRLSDMAYDASWRSDESDGKKEFYKPVEEIDLLLLGDICDMIRSEKWNNAVENIMPWTSLREEAFFNKVEEISDGILERNAMSFAILKDIASGELRIPQSMEPASEQEKNIQKIKYSAHGSVSIKVNIYYMIGNHDWFYFIDDPRMNKIRNKVIDQLGLANERDKPFPHDPDKCAAIKQLQETHRVYAIHGDEYDKTNFQTPNRDTSSVGDVVVIKLLNEIPKKIQGCIEKRGKAGEEDKIALFINELREIDNLRPYSLAPAWITQVLKETKLDDQVVNDAIKEALRSVIKNFRSNTIVAKDFKLKYGMKIAELLLSGHFSIQTLSNLIRRFGINKDKFESYKQFAASMCKDRELDFFIMGHTHYTEVVPLCSYIDKSGKKRTKIYINTGTWRSLHKTGMEDNSFISYKTITITGFFKPDERKGRPFEFWTGSLAL